MKNYFKFNLTGNKLFPVWLFFLVLFIAPYVAIIFKMKEFQPQSDPMAFMYIFPAMLFLSIVAFVITFYLIKLFIEGIEYKEKSFVFNGSIGNFVSMFLLGLFLSIITIGIYAPWFVKNIQKFFLNNSSHDSNAFDFKGKGGELFGIILVTLLIPVGILVAFTVVFTLAIHSQGAALINLIYQILIMFVTIPYTYFIYKWMVNIGYKGYTIVWKTDAWDACGKIFVQILLSVITLGIYYPMAIIKLYHYFVGKTVATSNEKIKKFGYNIEPMNDFLFLWGQTLLIIVTLGIYYPWASCKMLDRIVGKTYCEETKVA